METMRPKSQTVRAWCGVQAYLQQLSAGLLGQVAGVLLQPLHTHQHRLRPGEAAHQAREQPSQRQGIRQRQANQS